MTINCLSKILVEAFDSGYQDSEGSCYDAVTAILEKHKIYEKDDKPPSPTVDVDFRIYTSKELRNLPVGSTFMHQVLGKCSIKKASVKYMNFEDPELQPSGFTVDTYPWDIPMKRLS